VCQQGRSAGLHLLPQGQAPAAAAAGACNLLLGAGGVQAMAAVAHLHGHKWQLLVQQ
jgi:hypothetical protein